MKPVKIITTPARDHLALEGVFFDQPVCKAPNLQILSEQMKNELLNRSTQLKQR